MPEVESFDFLDFVRVQSTPHGLSATYLLTEKDTPLADPTGTTITIGDSLLTLSDASLNGFKDAQEKIEIVTGTVNTNKAETNAELDELAQTAIELQSNIERTAQELVSQMSVLFTNELEKYQEQVSTQFSQTATDFNFQFDKLISQISNVNGETNLQFSEIHKYIRFEDGNIILGRSDSPLTLRIQSDRISFILDNVEIAYFSSGRLYVDNLEAITTLTVGRFAWVPRSNGNLSLKMIKPQVSNAFAVWNMRTSLAWEDLGAQASFSMDETGEGTIEGMTVNANGNATIDALTVSTDGGATI